jgi:hypothetical protein
MDHAHGGWIDQLEKVGTGPHGLGFTFLVPGGFICLAASM